MNKIIDIDEPLKTGYCIPEWLRDEQIKLAVERKLKSVEPMADTDEPVAVVCFGPSLKDTWEEIRAFRKIITCSGAHKFLLERGIVPTWHLEVDPRQHKIELLGDPHPGVTYLPSSTCHPKYFDHLLQHVSPANVRIWHIYENDYETAMKMPRGEMVITGGIDAGKRCMTMARFFGHWNQHIFGMDGSSCECTADDVPIVGEGKTKHAAPHPVQDKTKYNLVEYPKGSGRWWRTTPALLQAAKNTWHELDMMPTLQASFYGHGLVQEMAKHYVRKHPRPSAIAAFMPKLISDEYRELNARMHRENLAFGVGGGKHAETVTRLKIKTGAASVLDYGAGKGYLAKALKFPIWEYDPAIPGKDHAPRPAELVVCTDVLEHVEPDKLQAVLDDLRRVTIRIGFFVIHTGPSSKNLPDGRNAHLIQQPEPWWREQLGRFFQIGAINQAGPLLYCVVSPMIAAQRKVA
jgi:hypothetical protein